MQPEARPIKLWRIAVLTVAVCAVLATVMVPALSGTAVATGRAETGRALDQHLSDAPPPLASSDVGGQCEQRSNLEQPGGEHVPPGQTTAATELASARPGTSR